MRELSFGKIKSVHPYAWLWEPLEHDPGFVLRPMFGTKAAYMDGRLVLCFAAKAEPWRGVLVCTDRTHHASLTTQFGALSPHSILPKWLYLPESDDAFEATAQRLVTLARNRDPRLGIEPGNRRSKLRAPRAGCPTHAAAPLRVKESV